MTGYSFRTLVEEGGFFHIWLATTKRHAFFRDNLEKLFFLAQLKNLLKEGQGIDLLAYSLSETGGHLLVNATTKPILEQFTQTLMQRYSDYLSQRPRLVQAFDALLITDRLAGSHEALNVSREIHLLHDDWRHAHYSSIGFYLDARTADWLQPKLLTDLYDNDPERYLALISSRRTESDRIFEFIET